MGSAKVPATLEPWRCLQHWVENITTDEHKKSSELSLLIKTLQRETQKDSWSAT